jgi:hypothetical protein
LGNFSAHHQEFSTAQSALFFYDRFQAESGWNSTPTLLGNGHKKNLHIYQCRLYSGKLLMTGREVARNMQSFMTE